MEKINQIYMFDKVIENDAELKYQIKHVYGIQNSPDEVSKKPITNYGLMKEN